MRVSCYKIKTICKNRGLSLTVLLKQARISRTAYYSLTQKELVVPKSLQTLAESLGVTVSDILFDPAEEERRLLRLYSELNRIKDKYPKIDSNSAWHTLLQLELSPLERLQRGLRGGNRRNLLRTAA